MDIVQIQETPSEEENQKLIQLETEIDIRSQRLSDTYPVRQRFE